MKVEFSPTESTWTSVQVEVSEVNPDLAEQFLGFVKVACEALDLVVCFLEGRFKPIHLVVDVLKVLKGLGAFGVELDCQVRNDRVDGPVHHCEGRQ